MPQEEGRWGKVREFLFLHSALTLVLFLCITTLRAQGALIHEYHFDNSLNDEVGTAHFTREVAGVPATIPYVPTLNGFGLDLTTPATYTAGTNILPTTSDYSFAMWVYVKKTDPAVPAFLIGNRVTGGTPATTSQFREGNNMVYLKEGTLSAERRLSMETFPPPDCAAIVGAQLDQLGNGECVNPGLVDVEACGWDLGDCVTCSCTGGNCNTQPPTDTAGGVAALCGQSWRHCDFNEKWMHVVVTRKMTAGDPIVGMWINGVKYVEESSKWNLLGTTGTPETMLGGLLDGGTIKFPFEGVIDELKIWDGVVLLSDFAHHLAMAIPDVFCTATPTQSSTSTPSTTSTPTRSLTSTATMTVVPTHTPTRTLSITPTPSTTITVIPTSTPKTTKTPTPSITPLRTKTSSDTATKTVSHTRSPSPSMTTVPTHTPSPTPTTTYSATRSRPRTVTDTGTYTVTRSKSNSDTITPTGSTSPTPTATSSISHNPTLSATLTHSDTATATRTLTATESKTHTRTTTGTVSESQTVTKTMTTTASFTLSPTPSETTTRTASLSRTRSATKTGTPSPTRSATPSLTRLRTYTATSTASSTATPTMTAVCQPFSTVCAYCPFGTPCDDLNPDTVDDRCLDGICFGTAMATLEAATTPQFFTIKVRVSDVEPAGKGAWALYAPNKDLPYSPIFTVGGQATPGLKSLAETGDNTAMLAELQADMDAHTAQGKSIIKDFGALGVNEPSKMTKVPEEVFSIKGGLDDLLTFGFMLVRSNDRFISPTPPGIPLYVHGVPNFGTFRMSMDLFDAGTQDDQVYWANQNLGVANSSQPGGTAAPVPSSLPTHKVGPTWFKPWVWPNNASYPYPKDFVEVEILPGASASATNPQRAVDTEGFLVSFSPRRYSKIGNEIRIKLPTGLRGFTFNSPGNTSSTFSGASPSAPHPATTPFTVTTEEDSSTGTVILTWPDGVTLNVDTVTSQVVISNLKLPNHCDPVWVNVTSHSCETIDILGQSQLQTRECSGPIYETGLRVPVATGCTLDNACVLLYTQGSTNIYSCDNDGVSYMRTG